MIRRAVREMLSWATDQIKILQGIRSSIRGSLTFCDVIQDVLGEAKVHELADGTAVHHWSGQADQGEALPVVVMLHGWLDGGIVYRPLVRALGGSCHAIAPDAPGHCHSSRRKKPVLGAEEMTDGAVAAIDAIPELFPDAGPVVVYGHSLGSVAAVRAAVRRPDVVKHVVLEELPWKPHRPFMFRQRVALYIARLQATPKDRLRARHAAEFDWSDEDLDLWVETKHAMDQRVMRTLRTHGDDVLDDPSSAVPCPVTAMFGRDPLAAGLQDRLRETLNGRAPQLTIRQMPTGHNIRRENLALVVEEVRGILAGVTADRTTANEPTTKEPTAHGVAAAEPDGEPAATSQASRSLQ